MVTYCASAIVQGDDNAFIQHDFVPINNTKDSEHRATSKIDPKIVALINKLSLDKDIDKKSENSTTVIPSGEYFSWKKLQYFHNRYYHDSLF